MTTSLIAGAMSGSLAWACFLASPGSCEESARGSSAHSKDGAAGLCGGLSRSFIIAVIGGG